MFPTVKENEHEETLMRLLEHLSCSAVSSVASVLGATLFQKSLCIFYHASAKELGWSQVLRLDLLCEMLVNH